MTLARGGSGGPPPPAVAVWADYWLPASETFIVNQLAAMRRYTPVRIGFRPLLDGLPVTPDLVPFTGSLPSRLSRRALGTRGHLLRYAHLLRERQVRVVHAHFGPGAINVLPIVHRVALPLVVTFHGYDVTRLPQQPGWRGRRYRHGLQTVFARADRLVAVSAHVEERLLELGAPVDKVVVRYIGAPAPSAATSRADILPTTRTGITFVGRLVEKKGVDDLLRAVALLPPHLRDTPVAILGSGEQEESLRRLAAQLRVDARFHGQATPTEVTTALASAAVFCGPSRTARDGDTEGLPTALIEAAHRGAPIVSTRHAGIPEFARDGREALLVDEGDVRALSAALHRLLLDRSLADRLAAQARARARTSFEIGACTAQLEALYDVVTEEAAGRHGAPRAGRTGPGTLR